MNRSKLTLSASSVQQKLPDRKSLENQLQEAQQESKQFKQLYLSSQNEISQQQQSQSFQLNSQRHPPSLSISGDDLKIVISKQQQQIDVLLSEQKETYDLIESLYLKDQAHIREIHILTRALQLKAQADNTNLDQLKDLALNTDVNLNQNELVTLLRAQVAGLTKQNKELQRKLNEFRDQYDYSSKELLSIETQRHTLQMENTDLRQGAKKYGDERSKLVMKVSEMQQVIAQMQTQFDSEKMALERANREMIMQINKMEEDKLCESSPKVQGGDAEEKYKLNEFIQRQTSLQLETNQQMVWLKEYYEEEIQNLYEQHSQEAIHLKEKLRSSLHQINQLEQILLTKGQSPIFLE